MTERSIWIVVHDLEDSLAGIAKRTKALGDAGKFNSARPHRPVPERIEPGIRRVDEPQMARDAVKSRMGVFATEGTVGEIVTDAERPPSILVEKSNEFVGAVEIAQWVVLDDELNAHLLGNGDDCIERLPEPIEKIPG